MKVFLLFSVFILSGVTTAKPVGKEKDNFLEALLAGKHMTAMETDAETEAQILSRNVMSNLRSFVNQMTLMLRKYNNFLHCIPRMNVEMQRSDEYDEELVRVMVDKLADIQGKHTKGMQQLFRRVQQFIISTRNKGTTFYRKFVKTLAQILRGYNKIMMCIRKSQG